MVAPALRVGVFGTGVVGQALAKRLAEHKRHHLTLVTSRPATARARCGCADADVLLCSKFERRLELRPSLLESLSKCDVVAVCTPRSGHAGAVRSLLRRDVAVVSCSDDLQVVQRLLRNEERFEGRGQRLVLGAGFAPGVTDLLAKYASQQLDQVSEVHVAKQGTGGPACARAHHRALGSLGVSYEAGEFANGPGGSGRELCFFPSPVDSHDCYVASLPDPVLMVRALPGLGRATARVAATRRDRLTARLPMMSPPHGGDRDGAIRVEVRGERSGVPTALVYGMVGRPGEVTAAVIELMIAELAKGNVRVGINTPADSADDPGGLLGSLTKMGHITQVFEGIGA